MTLESFLQDDPMSPPPDRRTRMDLRTMRIILGRAHFMFGLACLLFPEAFKLPLYRGMPSPELWGLFTLTLGVLVYLVKAPTPAAVLNVISAVTFVVITISISWVTPNTGTGVYLMFALTSLEALYLNGLNVFLRRRAARRVGHGG